MIKLNLGCGGNIIPGYINISYDEGKEDSEWYKNHDLSKGIPYDENTVDMIYHCHFLEHLSYFDGIALLKNCYKAMKEGAIMRILVPDLELWCLKYLQHDREFLDAYRTAFLGPFYPTDGAIFMGMLHNHGHKMGWDFDTLEFFLKDAGFKDIQRTYYQESKIEKIEELEPNNMGRALESLCVECVK